MSDLLDRNCLSWSSDFVLLDVDVVSEFTLLKERLSEPLLPGRAKTSGSMERLRCHLTLLPTFFVSSTASDLDAGIPKGLLGISRSTVDALSLMLW